MHNIVRKHIEGEISMDEVRRLIDELKKSRFGKKEGYLVRINSIYKHY